MPLSPDDIADVIADAIKAATAPLLARIELLEVKGAPAAIVGEKGKDGVDGKDAAPVDLDVLALKAAELVLVPTPKDGTSVTLADVAPLITDAVQQAVSALPPAKDGKDGASVDPAVVEAMVAKSVAEIPHPKDGKDAEVDLDALALKAAGLIPTPKDGASVTVEDVTQVIADLVQKAVAELPPAKDGAPGAPGESVDPAEVEAMVTKAVAAIPVPKDGQSVTVEDVAPLVASEVTKAVSALPAPKDGIGVAGALINKDGLLVLTLSDGSLKELGLVVGKDGERGEAGVSGSPGADGRDGTLEHLKVVRQDERTIVLCFKDGTPLDGGVITLNHPVFKDTYVEGAEYKEGDLVQWAGSGWIALRDFPPMKPGSGTPEVTGWKLWIKRGGDGKPGPQGPKGDKGLDLRGTK